MPHDLSDIIRNIPSFVATLSLFPNRSNFRDVPAFIHTFFQDQQVATNPFDRQQDSQRSSYNDQPLHLGSSFLIAFTHLPLVNDFGNPTPGIIPNAPLTKEHHPSQTTRQENHPTFAYPPIHETFSDDNDDNNNHENDEDESPQAPLASPDALTSSTRTNFTYPPIEDLTRTLLKYAKTANLWKLSYPTDLLSRR
jgi:hypothetical protein